MNNPLTKSSFINSNLTSFSDFFNIESNTFFTYEELHNMHGYTIDYLYYRSIISATPSIWKHLVSDLDLSESPQETKLEQLNDMYPTKNIYWKLIEKHKNYVQPFKQIWQSDLKLEITDDEWSEAYVYVNRITKSTKLQYLHFRIMNKKLTTNVKRSKWDKNVSPLCTFCLSVKETILHIYVECPQVKRLWAALKKWFNYFYSISCEFTPRDIILNNIRNVQSDFTNIIMLIMKQYIYSTKCKQQVLAFTDFISYLNHWYNIERTTSFYDMSSKKYSLVEFGQNIKNCKTVHKTKQKDIIFAIGIPLTPKRIRVLFAVNLTSPIHVPYYKTNKNI